MAWRNCGSASGGAFIVSPLFSPRLERIPFPVSPFILDMAFFIDSATWGRASESSEVVASVITDSYLMSPEGETSVTVKSIWSCMAGILIGVLASAIFMPMPILIDISTDCLSPVFGWKRNAVRGSFPGTSSLTLPPPDLPEATSASAAAGGSFADNALIRAARYSRRNETARELKPGLLFCKASKAVSAF